MIIISGKEKNKTRNRDLIKHQLLYSNCSFLKMSESTNQQETALREIVEDTTNANEPTAIDKTTLPNETSHERETTTTENASSEIENIEPQVATHNSDLDKSIPTDTNIISDVSQAPHVCPDNENTVQTSEELQQSNVEEQKMEFHNGLEQLKEMATETEIEKFDDIQREISDPIDDESLKSTQKPESLETEKVEADASHKGLADEAEQLSDEEINVDDISSDDNSESSSSEESLGDSFSDESSDENETSNIDYNDVEDEDEDSNEGPVKSVHEIIDEKAPSLPDNYEISPNTPIEEIGEITGLVENTIIIKARTSGEFRILQEKSIFCFEDRTVIGPLFEIFGRVQQPVYSVKFNSEEQFLKFKESKGKTVYYVVPDSQFLYTDSIKHIKGTDASNCHDEELPEEEQEYSDDEKELAAKLAKKKKKNKKTKDKQTHTSGPSLPNKRQKVSAYSPITTYSQNAVHNRGRQILPQHNTIYSNYGQQQPPQQQQQQSPPVAQYGQPYYPQTDSYNSLMGQTPQYPQPTFGQSQHFYQNAYNQPVQPQYQPAYQPPQQYNQYQQQPQEQQQQQQFNPNMPNAQTQQQVDPAQLEHLQRLLLQHLQNNQNQYQHPPQ